MGGQIIFEVEHADQFGLVNQGQAENGTGVLLTNVGIRGKGRLR